jgi:hypothetical protein
VIVAERVPFVSESSKGVNLSSINCRIALASFGLTDSASRQTRAQGAARCRITWQFETNAGQKPSRLSACQPEISLNRIGVIRASADREPAPGRFWAWALAAISPAITSAHALEATLEWSLSVRKGRVMWLIFLEAGLALAIFLFIIWWTMRGKR